MVLGQTRVAVRLLYLRLERVLPYLRFSCKSEQNEEPTSGLEPLTPAPATSDHSGVAGVCWGLLMLHSKALFSEWVGGVFHNFAPLMLSGWFNFPPLFLFQQKPSSGKAS